MKKLISMFAALPIAATLFLNPVFADDWQYKDLPSTSPYHDAFQYLQSEGVFSRTVFANPDVFINKVDLITWIVRLNHPNFRGGLEVALPFVDAENDAYYAQYIQKALNEGYISATGDYLNPFAKVTAGDVSQILFSSQGIRTPKLEVDDVPFDDLKNHRQQGAVMKAYDSGIIPNEFPQSESYFGIYQRINKAQVAQMFYRFAQFQGNVIEIGNDTQKEVVPQSTIAIKASASQDPYLEDFTTIWETVNEEFYPLDGQQPDKALLLEGAANGLFDALGNTYSAYYNSEEAKSFTNNLSGNVTGIGAYINEKPFDENFNEVGQEVEGARNFTVIVSPIKSSPAEEADLRPSDIILEIDGKSTEDVPIETVANWIRGASGTEVKILIHREGIELVKTITRAKVEIPTVEYEKRNEVMWIQLHQFNQKAYSDLIKVIELLRTDEQVKGFILDLRNNPGGLLTQAVEVTELFVEPGDTVVTIRGNGYTQVFESDRSVGDKNLLNNFPVVILVNEGSASASEILAGTLQDYGIKVIGTQTFGKGSVQSINDLNVGAFKLNVAGWYTAKGRSIEEEGVIPDVAVENAENVEKGSAEDVQLNKAILEVKKLF